jgi:hypothetical protein
MNFGVDFKEKIINSVLITLISVYIIGSILFFVDVKSIIIDYNNVKLENDTKFNNLSKKDIELTSNFKIFNNEIEKIKNINNEQYTKISDELKSFEFVVLKSNDKLLKELEKIRKFNNNNFVFNKTNIQDEHNKTIN